MSKTKVLLNILVLAALIATVTLGWLAGHILRFSIPEFWHPPIEEINPKIKTGYPFEFEGKRIVASVDEPWVRVYMDRMPVNSLDLGLCNGNTYYTSLPAKCQSADGQLVRVREGVIIIPGSGFAR